MTLAADGMHESVELLTYLHGAVVSEAESFDNREQKGVQAGPKFLEEQPKVVSACSLPLTQVPQQKIPLR